MDNINSKRVKEHKLAGVWLHTHWLRARAELQAVPASDSTGSSLLDFLRFSTVLPLFRLPRQALSTWWASPASGSLSLQWQSQWARCPALLPGPTRSCKRSSPDGHPEPAMKWSDGGGQPRLFGGGVYVSTDAAQITVARRARSQVESPSFLLSVLVF